MEVHRADDVGYYITDCCTPIVRCINWCSSCGRQQSYSQAFLEERMEPRAASVSSSPYQAPVQATSSGASPGSERAALLPKASELRASAATRSGEPMSSKVPKWAAANEEQMTTVSTPKKGGKGTFSSKGRVSSGLSLAPSEDGDFCSTCLEPYTEENPAILTKCDHRFHLQCIYEWLGTGRQTCPLCEREMSFEEVCGEQG